MSEDAPSNPLAKRVTTHFDSKGRLQARARENRLFAAEFITAFVQGHPTPATRAAEVLIEYGAVRSGTPEKYGQMMYSRKPVRTAIDEAVRKAMYRIDMDAEKLLALVFERIAFDPAEAFDPEGRPLPIRQIPPKVRRHIQSVDMAKGKITFADRDAAMKLVANHLGVGTEKLEVTANIDFAAAVLGSMPVEERPEGWRRMGIPFDEADAVVTPKEDA